MLDKWFLFYNRISSIFYTIEPPPPPPWHVRLRVLQLLRSGGRAKKKAPFVYTYVKYDSQGVPFWSHAQFLTKSHWWEAKLRENPLRFPYFLDGRIDNFPTFQHAGSTISLLEDRTLHTCTQTEPFYGCHATRQSAWLPRDAAVSKWL